MSHLVGLSNVLVDALYQVSDEVITSFGMSKGEASDDPARVAFARKFAEESPVPPVLVPGGSVGNVMANAALVGLETVACGAAGNDSAGCLYRQEMVRAGVKDRVVSRDGVTGTVFSFVTPDAQRTMVFDLGCAQDYHIAHVPVEEIERAGVFHTSVYELQGGMRASALHAMRVARNVGVRVGLDLANSKMVASECDFYQDLVKECVDVVFGNEDEALSFAGESDVKHAARKMAGLCALAVVTVGSLGTLVASKNAVLHVPAARTSLRDTTGAGDAQRAGFYYGLLMTGQLHTAALCGGYVAARVCEVMGPRLPHRISDLDLIVDCRHHC
ncbi:adenosine kinase [Candidatus Woesearchaeota archaeon]|nr:adenosine kinase [Candidatus Woesearchaeota archaeon]